MLKHWKDHFHPHEGNDNNPSAYGAAGAVALGLVVLTIISFTSLQSHYITNSERFLSAVLPSVLVDLTNEDRAKAGLDGLEHNDKLQAAAQLKADHMAENGYFAHYAPDGTTPWEWFAQAGYEYELAGENLAINFSDSKDVEEAWMDSPQHRDNILEEGFTEIGIATTKGEYEGDKTVFVVQLFARPSAANLAQRDESDADATEDEDVVDQTSDDDSLGQNDADQPATTSDEVALITTEDEAPDETVVDNSGSEMEAAGEPAPVVADSTPEPEEEFAESATEETSTSSLSATATPEEATTAVPAFATPTPIAQVQGESGISLQTFGSDVKRQASQLAHLMSQPEFLFRTLMLTLFALIALALLISVGVEAKRHHVNHALKSLGALVALLIIFYLGTMYLFPDSSVVSYNDSRLSAEMSLVGSTPSS